MNQDASTQAEVDALDAEFGVYITKLRRDWLARNRPNSRDVYEVMSARDREEVHQIIAGWSRYVTPLAEAWWKKRGYGVVWPKSDSEPMQFYRLEAEAT